MPRIIAGSARGTRLRTLKGNVLRPTYDRVKETMFNVLGPMGGLLVLDLFAGTGSLGIEALSRGAERAVFVEKRREAARLVRENLMKCRLEERARVVVGPCDREIGALAASGDRFDLVMLDPPYGKSLASVCVSRLVAEDLVAEEGRIIVEHGRDEAIEPEGDGLSMLDRRTIGSTALSIFRVW
ncbi:16S rRNA (guanine(966)-N(2))-methyltransferase RsmD [Thermodesulfobacteriota bacterium]